MAENMPDSYRTGVELMLGSNRANGSSGTSMVHEQESDQEFRRKAAGLQRRSETEPDRTVLINIKHPIAFSPDFLLNNRFSFNHKGFEASLQSQFVSKQYMTNAEVEELTLDKYFVSNLNLAYTFRRQRY